MIMDDYIEMTVSACYNAEGSRRIRQLKLLRIALILCLFMAWTYGLAIAAAFVQDGSGMATVWMMRFVAYTIPATVLLILVWYGLHKLSRSFDYCLHNDQLEVWNSRNDTKRKLVVQINCFSLATACPEEKAPACQGRLIDATVSKYDRWALDVRHEGQLVRVLIQPNEELMQRLAYYVSQ